MGGEPPTRDAPPDPNGATRTPCTYTAARSEGAPSRLVANAVTDNSPRRGWREPLDSGIYRDHRVSCESTTDHRTGRRCGCPLRVALATGGPATRWVTVDSGLTEARRVRARAAADAGTVRAVEPSEETLHDFAARWFQARSATLRPATLEIHERAYARRIAPTLGDLRLDELTRERLEGWLGGLVQRDPARRAVEQSIATLRAMLSTAVAWHRTPTNAALRLRMPKPISTSAAAIERVLTPEEIDHMLAYSGGLRGETLLRCAVEAGLRRGEIIGLRWSDVLVDTRRLRVLQSVWQGPGGSRLVQTPKSGHARRVAISGDLAEHLAAYFREQVVEGGAPLDGLVWPGRDGAPLGKGTPGQFLERVLHRARLVTREGEPVVTFHGLRHTAAALAFARGVPLLTISRQLGHASPAITARIYAHLYADSQLDAFADAMGHRTRPVDLDVEI